MLSFYDGLWRIWYFAYFPRLLGVCPIHWSGAMQKPYSRTTVQVRCGCMF